MTSDFDAIFAIAGQAQTAVYGETVTVTPMARTAGDRDARPSPDTTRTPVTCVGIWDDVPTDVFPEAQNYPSKGSHKVSAGKITVSIAKSAIGYEPVQGDIVTRVATGARLSVANPADDGVTEWVLTLSAGKG